VTSLVIAWLYPTSLSTYGDRGNVLTLVRRARWRDIDVRLVRIEERDELPAEIDLVFIGGGQDRAQTRASRALDDRHGTGVLRALDRGAALLAVCGGYQLLCHEYVSAAGQSLRGLGVFDARSVAGKRRLTGRVHAASRWGDLFGFENHAGRTYPGAGAVPFGRIVSGHGNNGEDRTEGQVVDNAIGTYLHGPLLPLNPLVADWLLLQGIRRREPDALLVRLGDEHERAVRSRLAETWGR
jgi:CobQ-like glutamine amidotransferase family enzyme